MESLEKSFDQSIYEDPIKIVEREFLLRKQRNPLYSLRSFARDLNVSPSQLSRVFNKQRSFTPNQAARIAAALGLSKKETTFLVKTSILNAPVGAKVTKALRIKTAQDVKREKTRTVAMSNLTVERFKAISQWYHLPILELTYLDSFQSDERWIAKQLGISTIETRDAIERLINLGLLEECPKKGLKKTINHLFINSKSEPEVRRYERTMIEKTLPILDQENLYDPNAVLLNSITFPVSKTLIPEIRDAIIQFQRRILKLIQKESYDEVYQMNCQLFPLTKTQRVSK